MEITNLIQLLNSMFGTTVSPESGTVYYLYLIFGFILIVIFIKLVLTLVYSMFGIKKWKEI